MLNPMNNQKKKKKKSLLCQNKKKNTKKKIQRKQTNKQKGIELTTQEGKNDGSVNGVK
jgi:hypothetical protein